MPSNTSPSTFALDVARPILGRPRVDVVFDPDVLPAPHPREVPLAAVSGGFNSVVQIAAKTCLRVVRAELGVQFHASTLSDSRLDALFTKVTAPFNATALDDLRGGGSTRRLAIVTAWSLVSLRFVAGRRVALRFRGKVSIGTFEPPFIPSDRASVQQLGREAVPDIGLADLRTAEALNVSTDIGLFTTRGSLDDFVDPAFFREIDTLGRVFADVEAPYALAPDPKRKRADVHVEFDDATVRVDAEEAAGDVAKLLKAEFFGPKAVQLVSSLIDRSRVRLVPTLSILGRNPVHVDVPEFPDFEALAFHVERGIAQALCVAFDLKPGCHGIVEEVRHFIGGADFGVITDEFVVERVFRHKWSLGGFARSFVLEGPTKVKRGDGVIDAVVHGTFRLGTLDLIALEALSDLRVDVLRLRGSASLQVEWVRLADGSIHYAPSDEYLGFPVEQHQWGVLLGLTVGLAPIDAHVEALVRSVYRDAYQHIAFPFARAQEHQARLSYARFDAITRRVFHLGRVREVFV